jgi:hypothetical protein
MEVLLIDLLACLEEDNPQAESVPSAHFRSTIRLPKKKNDYGIYMSPSTHQVAAPTVTEKDILPRNASFPGQMDWCTVVLSATLYCMIRGAVGFSLLTKMDL